MCLIGIQVPAKLAQEGEHTKNTAVAGCWRIYGAPEAAGSRVNNLESRVSMLHAGFASGI